MLRNIFKYEHKITNKFSFFNSPIKFFTGKTETGWNFTTPTLRMKSVKPIYPPPGDNIEIPRNILKITIK